MVVRAPAVNPMADTSSRNSLFLLSLRSGACQSSTGYGSITAVFAEPLRHVEGVQLWRTNAISVERNPCPETT